MNLIDENYRSQRTNKKIYMALGGGIVLLMVIVIALVLI